MSSNNNNVLSVTERAVSEVKKLLQARGKESLGIRIGIKSGGCSGFKYYLEYADSQNQYDEVVKTQDLTLLIDPKALIYLLGTEMDYIEEQFKAGFVFNNPNEKGKCGCGNSFSL